jgi:hypothetical protein
METRSATRLEGTILLILFRLGHFFPPKRMAVSVLRRMAIRIGI